jgi:hypothetical protein
MSDRRMSALDAIVAFYQHEVNRMAKGFARSDFVCAQGRAELAHLRAVRDAAQEFVAWQGTQYESAKYDALQRALEAKS